MWISHTPYKYPERSLAKSKTHSTVRYHSTKTDRAPYTGLDWAGIKNTLVHSIIQVERVQSEGNFTVSFTVGQRMEAYAQADYSLRTATSTRRTGMAQKWEKKVWYCVLMCVECVCIITQELPITTSDLSEEETSNHRHFGS